MCESETEFGIPYNSKLATKALIKVSTVPTKKTAQPESNSSSDDSDSSSEVEQPAAKVNGASKPKSEMKGAASGDSSEDEVPKVSSRKAQPSTLPPGVSSDESTEDESSREIAVSTPRAATQSKKAAVSSSSSSSSGEENDSDSDSDSSDSDIEMEDSTAKAAPTIATSGYPTATFNYLTH